MRTIVVTGSASGIGAAIRSSLEQEGARVIGVDVREADIVVDLATPAGRSAATSGALAASNGALDGVVACAGLGPQVADRRKLVAVNYFAAVAVLSGLRPALARGVEPAAVAISSNSAAIVPDADGELCSACLAGDEAHALDLGAPADGSIAYASSKLALARWVRREAVGADWAGAGIRLNAVAPGATRTPLLEDGLADDRFGPAIRGFPIPLGGFGAPEQIAAAVCFLLGPLASFCSGSVLFVDGGSDALIRRDRF